jgi:hypothetical protein
MGVADSERVLRRKFLVSHGGLTLLLEASYLQNGFPCGRHRLFAQRKGGNGKGVGMKWSREVLATLCKFLWQGTNTEDGQHHDQ